MLSAFFPPVPPRGEECSARKGATWKRTSATRSSPVRAAPETHRLPTAKHGLITPSLVDSVATLA